MLVFGASNIQDPKTGPAPDQRIHVVLYTVYIPTFNQQNQPVI